MMEEEHKNKDKHEQTQGNIGAVIPVTCWLSSTSGRLPGLRKASRLRGQASKHHATSPLRRDWRLISRERFFGLRLLATFGIHARSGFKCLEHWTLLLASTSQVSTPTTIITTIFTVTCLHRLESVSLVPPTPSSLAVSAVTCCRVFLCRSDCVLSVGCATQCRPLGVITRRYVGPELGLSSNCLTHP